MSGLFGRIHLKQHPMKIEINSRVNPTRAAIALVHELLHLGEELLKHPLNHKLLHRMAVAIFSGAERELRMGVVSSEDSRRIIERAAREAGVEMNESELSSWSAYFRREVVPTMREYMRRRA